MTTVGNGTRISLVVVCSGFGGVETLARVRIRARVSVSVRVKFRASIRVRVRFSARG